MNKMTPKQKESYFSKMVMKESVPLTYHWRIQPPFISCE